MQSTIYTLSITDAVVMSGVSVGKIRDLVLAGLLPCLIDRRDGGTEWFDPDDVRSLVQLRRDMDKGLPATMDARRVDQVGDALRRYLEALKPRADYDEALTAKAPVLAKTRSGVIHAHVQADVLAAWADVNCSDLPTAWLLGPVRSGLKLLGAIQVRGIAGLSGTGQRWHTWHRLPLTVWSAIPEHQELRYNLDGAREQGERVQRSGDETILADPLERL